MDDQRRPASPVKGLNTGIPQLSSRLPALKSSTTTRSGIPPPSAIRPPSALKSPSKLPSFRSSVNSETPSNSSSVGIPSSHNKRPNIPAPSSVAAKPPSAQGLQSRRPASPFKSSVNTRPGSRLAQPRARPLSIVSLPRPQHEDVNDQLGALDGFRASSRIGNYESGPEEDGSSSPLFEDATPKPSKSSRLSLSDRTIESLYHLPATPATDRRRSGFFNPDSPMLTSPMGPPSRPASSLSVAKRPGTSDGTFTKPLPRAASPVKRPVSVIQPSKRVSIDYSKATPVRRTVSTSLSKPSINSGTTPSFSASVRATKPPVSSLPASRSAIKPPTTGIARTTSTRLAKPATKTTPKPAASAVRQSALSKSTMTQVGGGADPPPAKSSKSSTALREQIAKAKAAKRGPDVTNDPGIESPSGGFDLDADPFNHRPKDNKGILLKRIEAARADGRLNVAAMGLSDIPLEVMNMYDSEQMAESNLTWNESVDLTRFIAADNQFESISDDAFPDVDPREAAEVEDGKMSPFVGLEMLDLHGNKLSTLPVGLRRLDHLTSLNLSHNQFGNAIFETISQITNLKELRLGHNNISGYLPASISKLKNLEVLELQGNKLLNLPEILQDLTNLRILNVSGNQLTGLPMDALERLPLTDLDASRNSLVGALFPFSVSGMPKLRELNVSNNSLASLAFSENLSLPALRMLSITNNRIVSLPDVSGWTELTTLTAGDNKIAELPSGFASLKFLKHADLSSNDLSRLDERIANMDGLESLLVDANPLKDRKFLSMSTDAIKRDLRLRLEPANNAQDSDRSVLSFEDEAIDVGSPDYDPSSPWKVASGTLVLSNKNLEDADSDLLRSFLGVNNVKEIQLSRNLFTCIPFELSLAQSLRVLDMTSCSLGPSFLTEAMALPALTDLMLADNKITTLQPLITHLHAPGLQRLDVEHNRLTGAVPHLREAFPHLTTLAASDNKFDSVAATDVKGLRNLVLARNNIVHLPAELGLLWFEGLRGFDVTGNAFRVPGHRVLEKGTEATMQWLRDRIPGYVGDDETF